jgi:hypothetical protein
MDPNILSALQSFGGLDQRTRYLLSSLHAQGQLSPNVLHNILGARGFPDSDAVGAPAGTGMPFPQNIADVLRALGFPGQF